MHVLVVNPEPAAILLRVDSTVSCFSTAALFLTDWPKLKTIGWPTPTPVLATDDGAGMRFALACCFGVNVVS
jgi:hypothetical protein